MGPDRPVVVAERVVRPFRDAHRAHAPARPEAVAGERVGDCAAATLGDDPRPEQVPDVGRERIHTLLRAVEGERVRLPLLDPVGLVEPRCEPVGVGVEAGGERLVPPDGARQLGDPSPRVVRVALHLDRGDRRGGRAPVGEPLRVEGVLPGLVLEASAGAALVLEEAVAVAVAVALDPFQRRQRGALQLLHDGAVPRPAP